MNFSFQGRITTNAAAYSRNLTSFMDASSRGRSEVLDKEGANVAQELFKQFRQIRPTGGSIFAAAAARGFAVRRKFSTSLVPTDSGLSARAEARAKELLGGQKSDFFRPLSGGMVPVRFGARKSHRILQGGRTGWRFSKSAMRAFQLTPGQLQTSLNEPMTGGGTRQQSGGIVRLNLRALATYLELRYRTRATFGGTMAIQWLHETYKTSSRWPHKTSQLVQRSATKIPIGTVDFETLGDELQAVVLKGFVPGTPFEAERYGIVGKVFGARAADLLIAIKNAHVKAARERGLN